MDMNERITDHRLMEVTGYRALRDAHDAGRRLYVALWDDGDRTHFAVASAAHAKVYASEWGIRFRNGDRPISVKWER